MNWSWQQKKFSVIIRSKGSLLLTNHSPSPLRLLEQLWILLGAFAMLHHLE